MSRTISLRPSATSNTPRGRPSILVIMGVSGSGKTTIGQLLSTELICSFIDGDDFHPPANIKKMSSGEALTDEDRCGSHAFADRASLELRLAWPWRSPISSRAAPLSLAQRRRATPWMIALAS